MLLVRFRLISLAVLLSAIITIPSGSSFNLAFAQTEDLFADLRGKWQGTGTMSFRDGDKARIACRADYTGAASQLILSIDCTSKLSDVHMTARISANNRNLHGTWRERHYGAIGSITGQIDDKTIRFSIGGNIFGKMTVRYSKSRQTVRVTTAGISLEEMSVSLRRR